MTDTLFDIPESVPKWLELASVHGIETEKEAVISLIHKMELKGWKTVTL